MKKQLLMYALTMLLVGGLAAEEEHGKNEPKRESMRKMPPVVEMMLPLEGRQITIRTFASGQLIETAEIVTMESRAEPLRLRMKNALGSAKLTQIELHIRYGVFKQHEFKKFSAPLEFYVIKCDIEGVNNALRFAAEPARAPELNALNEAEEEEAIEECEDEDDDDEDDDEEEDDDDEKEEEHGHRQNNGGHRHEHRD